MSKGKQWWPMRASVKDSRDVINEFQNRLRERQWIKKTEKAKLFHIYLTDTQWSEDNLISANEYMQISIHDSASKNQGRADISRLLSMLNKWHIAIREKASILQAPRVFAIPQLDTGDYSYGIVASISADDDKPQQKPVSLIISEHDILPKFTPGVRKWTMPQGEDSFRWMTLKTWYDHKKYPCFGKWIWGSFSDKRTFLDLIQKDIERKNQKGDIRAFLKQIDDSGMFSWDGKHTDQASKVLGAIYSFEYRKWIMPKFWDDEATKQWIEWADKANFYPDNDAEKKKYNYKKNASSISEAFKDREESLKINDGVIDE